jgi:hypothetical protein
MSAKVSVQQHDFTAGLLDPSLEARSDLQKYFKGASDATNMLGLTGGGMERRGGLKFVAKVPEAVNGARLTKFEFSADQTYLFLILEQQIKIFRDGVQVADLPNDLVLAEGQSALEPIPYTAADLDRLDWSQSLDTMLLVHPDYAPKELQRAGADDRWTFKDIDFTNLPTYRFAPTTEEKVTPSAKTGSNITFTAAGSLFKAEDVGSYIIGNDGKAEIISFTSATVVKCDIKQDFKDTTAIDAGDWTLEGIVWSDDPDPESQANGGTTPLGWPGAVFLYEGRSFWGRSKRFLQTVWASTSGEFFDFKDTFEALDDEGVFASLDGDRVNAIEQLHGLNSLFLFTSGGVFAATASPITPGNFIPLKNTTVPAANIRPVEIEDAIAFVAADEDNNALTLHLLLTDQISQDKRFIAEDLNLLSANAVNNPVDTASRKGRKDSGAAHHVFVVNGDGSVGVLHSRRSQNVVGWTRWDSLGNGGTDTVMRTAVAGNDVYFLIKRTLNGVVDYYLEVLDNDLTFDSSITRIRNVITNTTQTDPVSITASGHGFDDGDLVEISGIQGMTELNGNHYTVTNATVDGFDLLGVDGTAFGAYFGGGSLYFVRSISNVTFPQHGTVTATAHGFVQGDKVKFTGVVGTTELNDNTYRVDNVTVNAFELTDTQTESPVDVSAFTAYTSDGEIKRQPTVSVTGATQTNPVVITARKHGFVAGETVEVENVLGMTQLNGNRYVVANPTANTFELQSANGTVFSAYTSAGDINKVADVSGFAIDDHVLVTSASHKFINGETVQIAGVGGTTEINDTSFTVATATTDTFELAGIDSAAYTAYTSGGEITKVIAFSAATQTSPVKITAKKHGLIDGQRVTIANVVGMTELNTNTYDVSNTDTDTFELFNASTGAAIDGIGFTAYTSGGDAIRVAQDHNVLLGLGHLEGEVVSVWADGAQRDDATVVAGKIAITDGGAALAVETVEAGMGFDWALETMPVEAQLTDGTLIGKAHRLVDVTVRVRGAYEMTVNDRIVPFKSMRGLVLDAPLEPFTGLKTVRFIGWNPNDRTGATARMTGRLPITIESITATIAQ